MSDNKWLKKLHKADLIHLIESKITTLQKFMDNRNFQLEGNPAIEPCWDCWEIARRLKVCDFAPKKEE